MYMHSLQSSNLSFGQEKASYGRTLVHVYGFINFEVVAGESMIYMRNLRRSLIEFILYVHEITMSQLETADGELGREDIENVKCF